MSGHIPPALNRDAFTCPFCGVLAQMDWSPIWQVGKYNLCQDATCFVCGHASIWYAKRTIVQVPGGARQELGDDARMIYPLVQGPPPEGDMPDGVESTYQEARQVLGVSARGAGALIRVAAEELVRELGGEGRTFSDRIESLRGRGLSGRTARMLHTLRIRGNDSSHPVQEIDDTDTVPGVEASLLILNMVVREVISEQRLQDEAWQGLPETKRSHIEKLEAEEHMRGSDVGSDAAPSNEPANTPDP